MRSKGDKVALAVGVLCAAIAATIPPLLVLQFREVFVSFGADLPPLTELFIHYNLALWLLPVLVVATWLYWPKATSRSLVACLMGVASLVLVVPVLVVALYLPIFQLSAGNGL